MIRRNGNKDQKDMIKANDPVDKMLRGKAENLVWDNLPHCVEGVLEVLNMSLGIAMDEANKPNLRLAAGKLTLEAAEMFYSRTLPVLQAVKVSGHVEERVKITAEIITNALRQEAKQGGLRLLDLPVIAKDPNQMHADAQEKERLDEDGDDGESNGDDGEVQQG